MNVRGLIRGMIRRTALWHQERLPDGRNLSLYNVQTAGPKVTPSMGIRFHTYACLYPKRGLCIAANTLEWPGCNIPTSSIHRAIKPSSIPQRGIEGQRKLVVAYQGQGVDPQHNWNAAVELTDAVDLPVAFYAIGDNPAGRHVVVLYVVLTAPISMAADAFKKASLQTQS